MKKMSCLECETSTSYSGKYDAYYCSNCKKWLEPKCDNENCEFCKDRPETAEEEQ